jgi:DNA-binding NarL/FixJ family response regulator
MKTVVIIDPNPVLRRALVHLLSDISPDLGFEERDYGRLFGRVPVTGDHELVVLAFSRQDDLHNLTVSAQNVYSPKAILLLPDSDAIYPSLEGLPATVAGYVAKDSPCDVIRAATRVVLAGGMCFPLELSVNGPDPLHSMQGDLFGGNHAPAARPPLPAPPKPAPVFDPVQSIQAESEMLGITPRQYEVLVLLARGHSVKSISHHLAISVATVKSHAETLYRRLGVNNRNAAVYEAVTRGANLDRTFTERQNAVRFSSN